MVIKMPKGNIYKNKHFKKQKLQRSTKSQNDRNITMNLIDRLI